MNSNHSFKRKYCPVYASDVDIEVIEPLGSEEVDESQPDEINVSSPLLDYSNFFTFSSEEIEEIWDSVGEPVENPQLRISDVIRQLEVLQHREGDLLLCVADVDSLITLSPDTLDFKVTSKRSYNFAIGLEEENYLSVQIN